MPPPPRTPPPRNSSGTARKAPHGVLEVDWPFFGEMCRALALKIFREYDPDVVIGIARAGVIPAARLRLHGHHPYGNRGPTGGHRRTDPPGDRPAGADRG